MFDFEILGHDEFLTKILDSISSGRMHHAWLLTGPIGIGKASIAKLAAAILLSQNQKNIKSVDEISNNNNDPGFRLALKGTHPDYKIISPYTDDNKSGQIKIEQIRELIPFLAHKPAFGGWRIAIIDSMDNTNRNSSNAMLKLLEEPPDRTVLFLIGSRLGKISPTIRSRCCCVKMRYLSTGDCFKVVSRFYPNVDEHDIDILSKLSNGAPGKAISLSESGASDHYQLFCSMFIKESIDSVGLSSLCQKWGKGASSGRAVREGAVFCITRFLRYAALKASGVTCNNICIFEKSAIDNILRRHSAKELAHLQTTFVQEAMTAEALNIDFSKFLEQQLIKIYQKTLPKSLV